MKEMLEMLVKDLVDNPDKIEITEKEEGKATTLELKVDPSDMGKVIGRQGKIAKAIRVLMKAYAVKENKKINVEIIG
ncbi:MAG: KH domain-containing protein [Clostridia bacterium]|nr:KH domain-containing protein [Clostridia bacterium]